MSKATPSIAPFGIETRINGFSDSRKRNLQSHLLVLKRIQNSSRAVGCTYLQSHLLVLKLKTICGMKTATFPSIAPFGIETLR